MEIDDFIYIIIAIVLAIINAIANKKKKAAKQAAQHVETPADPIEVLLSDLNIEKADQEPSVITGQTLNQEMFVEEQPPKPQPDYFDKLYSVEYEQPGYETTEEAVELEDTESPIDRVEFSYTPIDIPVSLVETLEEAETAVPVEESATEEQEVLEPKEGAHDLLRGIIQDFDPAKAVIYSEILKPRYF